MKKQKLNIKKSNCFLLLLFTTIFMSNPLPIKANINGNSFIECPKNEPHSRVIGKRVINDEDLKNIENKSENNHKQIAFIEYSLENKDVSNKNILDFFENQNQNDEKKEELVLTKNGIVNENGFLNLELDQNVNSNKPNEDGQYKYYVDYPKMVLDIHVYDDVENKELSPDYQVEDNNVSINVLSDEELKEIENRIAINNEDHIKSILAFADSKIGSAYSQANRDSGKSFDCSSFVYYSYLSAGINISFNGNYTAAEIANGLVLQGKSIPASNLKEGDLIFYSHAKNGRFHNISHVSMYVGNGQMIEASPNKGVKYSNLRLSSVTDICRPSD